MGKVIASITTSVDGYVTGPDDGPEYGLGRGGERLHADRPAAETGFRFVADLEGALAQAAEAASAKMSAIESGHRSWPGPSWAPPRGPRPSA